MKIHERPPKPNVSGPAQGDNRQPDPLNPSSLLGPSRIEFTGLAALVIAGGIAALIYRLAQGLGGG